jgi:single-strand DNA-binding protein
MNQFMMSGRLTNDPETKQVGDKVLTKFSIAVKRQFGKEVDFIDIETWGKTAQNCANFISKGSLVLVNGRVEKRSFEAKDGRKITTFSFIASEVEFMNKIEKKETVPADDEEYF